MRWLVRLYPPAWRRRYEDEFLAVLETREVGPSVTLDVARGAFDAWMRGPRGDLGLVGIALALVAYGVASWVLAVARRVWLAPLGDPVQTVFEGFYWFASILFMTWLAARPNMPCDLSGLIARLRR